jgi:hypothetical protein
MTLMASSKLESWMRATTLHKSASPSFESKPRTVSLEVIERIWVVKIKIFDDGGDVCLFQ